MLLLYCPNAYKIPCLTKNASTDYRKWSFELNITNNAIIFIIAMENMIFIFGSFFVLPGR